MTLSPHLTATAAPGPCRPPAPAPARPDGREGAGTRRRTPAKAALVAAAPVLMALALAYHPYIPRLSNDDAVAAELGADTTRWALSHLAVGVASALLLLAFLAVGADLRARGEQLWSTLAMPFVVVGSTLFAFLPAMELAMVAVHNAGGDVAVVLDELNRWFVPVLVAGSLAFAIGVALLAVAIARSRVLGAAWTRVVVVALVVLAGSRFVPLGVALYVGAGAGIAALWPMAARMRNRSGVGPR